MMKEGGESPVASWMAVLMLCAMVTLATPCHVPSVDHPTVQSAVDDVACTEILLDSYTFNESVVIERDLTLRGASSSSSVIEGQVSIQGGTTQAEIFDLRIDVSVPSVAGCFRVGLLVQDGAQLDSRRLVVLNGSSEACRIFADGFESGDTSAWTSTVPSP